MHLPISQPFNLELSLTIGQAFRWLRLPGDFYATDGNAWFSGVLGDHLVHLRQTDDGLEYRAGGPDGETDTDLSDLLCRYFRLDTDDVAAIYARLSAADPGMTALIAENWGMRILRQEPWECLVSYICSATNKIARISAIVEKIAETFGQPVQLNGDCRYTFPQAAQLVADPAAGAELRAMRLGLQRDRNIIAAAGRVSRGELDWHALRQQSYPEVMRALMEGTRYRKAPNGIGPKIADCVALFALDQLNAFPVDTHVRDEVNDRYFHSAKPPSDARVVKWAQEKFGPYAGYAGEFLFHNQPK